MHGPRARGLQGSGPAVRGTLYSNQSSFYIVRPCGDELLWGGDADMLHNILAAVTTMVPLLALFMQFSMGTGMSERHHRHHDTYLVSIALTRALLLVIVFMSLLGLLLSWLCELGVYSANPVVVRAFFCTAWIRRQ